MGCQYSRDEGSVITSGEEFSVKRRKSLSQILLQPGRSDNMYRDVFSIFGEGGMTLNQESPSSVLQRSPFSTSESAISTASTASVCERTTTHAPQDQFIPKLNISYGSHSDKGMRKQNEDRKVCTYQLIKGEPVAYFGLYDGHGGEKVSEYLHQHLHHTIFDKLRKNVDMERSLADAFATTDDTIFKKQIDSGSTAVSVIIREKEVVIASVGDSQAILCSSGRALDFCVPHTPNLSSEKERIIAAKGTVVKGRIFGLLSVSRAFGDNDFKTSRGQFKDRFNGDLVSSSPDIVRHSISMEDEFIVLGCDGLFDVLEPQQVVDFVRTKLCQHGKIQQAAEELVAHAISIGSMDNVSAILVCFNQDYDAEKDI